MDSIWGAILGALLLVAGWWLGRFHGRPYQQSEGGLPVQQEELDRQLMNMLRYNGEAQYEDQR